MSGEMGPRFWRLQATTTDPTDDSIPDFNGWEIGVSWLGVMISFTISRIAA